MDINFNKFRTNIGSLFKHVILIVFSLFVLGPIYWLLVSSLKSRKDVLSIPSTWFPHTLHFENFVKIFQEIPLMRFFTNSIFISFVSIVCSLFFCTLAAYGLAKFNIPFKRILLLLLVSTSLLPIATILIPLYSLALDLHIVNTLFGLVFPYLISGYGILIIYQSMISIPNSIIESARIDGAGEITILFRIVFPLIRPALFSMSIFIFILTWKEFLWPLIVAHTEKLYNLPVGLAFFQYSYYPMWELFSAVGVLAILPVVIVFIKFQKNYIETITYSGLKG